MNVHAERSFPPPIDLARIQGSISVRQTRRIISTQDHFVRGLISELKYCDSGQMNARDYQTPTTPSRGSYQQFKKYLSLLSLLAPKRTSSQIPLRPKVCPGFLRLHPSFKSGEVESLFTPVTRHIPETRGSDFVTPSLNPSLQGVRLPIERVIGAILIGRQILDLIQIPVFMPRRKQ